MTDFTRRDLLKASGVALSAGIISSVAGSRGAEAHPAASTPMTPSAELLPTPRERILLDPGWRFHFGHATDPSKDFGYDGQSLFSKTGGMFEPSQASFDDSHWAQVDLPHDWAVELEFHNDPALDGHGYKPLGRNYPETSIGWYRRVFDVPSENKGKRLWLEFDGVYRDSIVALNGIYLGRHASGYTPFRYDISDFANYGGTNVLVVRVDATLGEGWWYEGAGIYRHVWLSKMEPVHVVHNGTFINSQVRQGAATLLISTEVENERDSAQNCRVATSILDPTGQTVGRSESAPASIPAGGRYQFQQQVEVSHPALWSVEQSNLYQAVSSVESAGQKDG